MSQFLTSLLVRNTKDELKFLKIELVEKSNFDFIVISEVLSHEEAEYSVLNEVGNSEIKLYQKGYG